MMDTFWLENLMLEHKNSCKQEGKKHAENAGFIAVIFRHH